jgi:tRNA1Val (adenine37-N6)-methyltransferase
MKVGTDGVLLGAWADVAACRTIADAGAGTGLIALMLAQRNATAQVDGVEIDPEACGQATDNVAASPFAQRIRMYQGAFRDFARTTAQRYDLIVSNPPYFTRSLKCPDEKRRLARHDDRLPLDELIGDSLTLLTPAGRIALILPVRQQDELRRCLLAHGLHCIRRTLVYAVAGAAPKRCLVELSRRPPSSPDGETDSLILEDPPHQRSAAYRELTREFYL